MTFPDLSVDERAANLAQHVNSIATPNPWPFASRLPLAHVTGSEFLRFLADPGARLRSQVARGKGLDDWVYLYVGAARRAFRNAQRHIDEGAGRVALLFAAEIEDALGAAIAHAWDTGEIRNFWEPPPERHALLRDGQLPVPQYRTYLAIFLAHCFSDPADYLVSRPPSTLPEHPHHQIVVERSRAPAFGRAEAYSQGWTFEVAVHHELPIFPGLRCLVVDRGDLFRLSRDEHESLVELLNLKGVTIQEVDLPVEHQTWRYKIEGEAARVIADELGVRMPSARGQS